MIFNINDYTIRFTNKINQEVILFIYNKGYTQKINFINERNNLIKYL